MKKIEKKVSFFTKILLVIGLLISNLSSLSVVFAAEVKMDATVVDNKLHIKYLDELAEDVEKVRVDVYENYTYLDMTSIEEVVNHYDLTDEEVAMLVSKDKDTSLVVESILSRIMFDGTYDARIEIVNVKTNNTTDAVTDTEAVDTEATDTEVTDSQTVTTGITDTETEAANVVESEPVEEVIDTFHFSTKIAHKSGLDIKMFDAVTNEEILTTDNKYSVALENLQVKVVAKILPGGLKPTDVFGYDNQEYFAEELLGLEFSSDVNFEGRLFGDYQLPVEVKLLNTNNEEVIYTENLNVLYGSYELNAAIMNMALATEELALNEQYMFSGDTQNGEVYVLLNATKKNTMLDLYKIANFVFEGEEYITYLLSNSQYSDVLAAYDATDKTMTLEEYLDTIVLDDSAVLSLINDGLTVYYQVMMVGDLNQDSTLSQEDLLELIDQVVGKKEVNAEKSDLYADVDEVAGTVDVLDVMYLDQVLKNDTWNSELAKEEAEVAARLDAKQEDIVSGDTFTVDYVLTVDDYAVSGVSGLFTYDKDMLELVSVETTREWVGSNHEGKFLYLGNTSMTGTTTTDAEGNTEVVANEYVLVSATFKALKAGTSQVSLSNCEYFNQNTYLTVAEQEISTEVSVLESDDNRLSALTVAGQEIALSDDVTEYEITVGNEVTNVTVDAIAQNVAANVTSIISPEELVEGANTVTVTVVAENGLEKVYTITVVREEAPKKENNPGPVNYTDNNNYEDNNTGNEGNNTNVDVPKQEDEPPVASNDDKKEEKESNVSRIIIIILILLVIAGLIYLIFKDEDDEETKATNKEINKLKKESEPLVKKTNTKPTTGTKNKNTNSKKKER